MSGTDVTGSRGRESVGRRPARLGLAVRRWLAPGLHRLEALLVLILFKGFAALPLDQASALGGWIGRQIGYRLPVTRRARRNLQRIFADWSEVEREGCLRRMWDNLGRTAGEYPHIGKVGFGPGQRVAIQGLEHLIALRDDGKPGLFFSAHFGNWELAGPSVARHGLPIGLIYRAANNNYVNWLFTHRRSIPGIEVMAKGSAGARAALRALRRGGHLGLLVDQKMNDGIMVPFLGLPAMTAPALAAFALEYDCPVVPAHVVREQGAHFRVIFEAPLRFDKTGDHLSDLTRAMRLVNQIIEGWIRDHPDQWLWLHKRWPET